VGVGEGVGVGLGLAAKVDVSVGAGGNVAVAGTELVAVLAAAEGDAVGAGPESSPPQAAGRITRKTPSTARTMERWFTL
jgi:hypothetical protein